VRNDPKSVIPTLELLYISLQFTEDYKNSKVVTLNTMRSAVSKLSAIDDSDTVRIMSDWKARRVQEYNEYIRPKVGIDGRTIEVSVIFSSLLSKVE
jgi:hypothetical protein